MHLTRWLCDTGPCSSLQRAIQVCRVGPRSANPATHRDWQGLGLSSWRWFCPVEAPAASCSPPNYSLNRLDWVPQGFTKCGWHKPHERSWRRAPTVAARCRGGPLPGASSQCSAPRPTNVPTQLAVCTDQAAELAPSGATVFSDIAVSASRTAGPLPDTATPTRDAAILRPNVAAWPTQMAVPSLSLSLGCVLHPLTWA